MQVITFLESHDKLAGWAQFLGAVIALVVTYLTAFAPQWRRKLQLKRAGSRVLQNAFEALESYHRTSVHYPPSPLSVRMACLSFKAVADESDRFPVFELDDHGPRSLARNLLAASSTLKATILTLESIADGFGDQDGTEDDRENIRAFVGDRMIFVQKLITGAELERPMWPVPDA